MRSKAVQLSVVVVVATALAGCQSGPRWAWWKHDAAPDASATARTAEPVLPSSQAKPQAVAVSGVTPTAPPSSANLAAAGTPTTPPSVSIPVTSSNTLAAAPSASYSPGNALADKITASNTAAKAGTTAPSSVYPSVPAAPTSQPFAAAPAATAAAGP